MLRSETPCVVGCADRLLVRRNRLNVGTVRSTSSASTAGEWRISAIDHRDAAGDVAQALFGPGRRHRDRIKEPRRLSTISSSPEPFGVCVFSATPGTDNQHAAARNATDQLEAAGGVGQRVLFDAGPRPGPGSPRRE